MNRFLKQATCLIAFCSMIPILITGLLYASGARVNTSSSIPIGLYWITQHPIQKGEYVLFCPPKKRLFQSALIRGYIHFGFCPGGFGYLMKKVVATVGDSVSINSSGVWVNHRFVTHSKPYQQDKQGRLLSALHLKHYMLKSTDLLLMGDQSELSFDARYFGLINRSQVKAVIRPVWIWTSPLKFTL